MDSSTLNVCVIGYGHLGKWHCEKVVAHKNKGVELFAIVEPSQEQREKIKKIYPHCKVFSDFDALKEVMDFIHAFIIVSPTQFHIPLIEKILPFKKHIFCEKPLGVNVSEIRQLDEKIQLALKENIVLQIGHSERFHHVWGILKNDHPGLFKGDGDLVINRLAPFKGRALDVNVMSDLMIHDLDLMIFLLEEFPLSVCAKAFKTVSHHWDYCRAHFTFPSGKSASLTVHRNHHQEVRSLEYFSSEQNLFVDLLHRKYEMNGKTLESQTQHTYPSADHLLLEHEHFYDSILNKKPVVVNFKDGLTGVNLVESVLKSVESGKTECIKPLA
jgi:predicted dehydrogenase